MRIKVGNEFLEFDDLIEVEKQIKLFEDIDTTDGDFSYSFEIFKSINNTRILGNPMPDNISKQVYQQIEASLISYSGEEVFKGYIRIEKIVGEVYQCSFFSGNNTWFAMIDGLLSELDLTQYDTNQTEANIISSWSNTEGLVFPLVDNGPLLTRSYPQTIIEDYVGGFYFKTLFSKIFTEAGIKIQGELLNDWMFNNAILLRNSKNQAEIDARSTYAAKTSAQHFNLIFNPSGYLTFEDDSTFPYFDGRKNNFNTSTGRYTADVDMILTVSVALDISVTGGSNGVFFAYAYVNGSFMDVIAHGQTTSGQLKLSGQTKRIRLNAGDYVEVRFTMADPLGGSDAYVTGTVKITPTYLYRVFGTSLIPNWTKQKFVSNVLRMFNVIPSYNSNNNTLTLNLFDKINTKVPIDLSNYISDVEVDYTDFISNYGQRSKFSYNEVDFDELKSYNFGKYFKYGQGVIEVNNDFLDPDAAVVESDFSNPVGYINNVFDMSIERTNLINLSDGDSVEFTGVTNNSGVARVAIPDDIFIVGDLVRIDDSTDPAYNGDWVVETVSIGWIELTGMVYSTNATGHVGKLEYDYSNDDDVFIFIHIPNYSINKFSGNTDFLIRTTTFTDIGLAYFNILNTGRTINHDYIYSLSFGGIESDLQYQQTLIDQYFRLLNKMLNDPVKLFSTAHLPLSVFRQIDFLSPIKIRTLETTNQYYLNRITGYKESYLPCILELIKI